MGGLIITIEEASANEIEYLQKRPADDVVESFFQTERSRLDLDKAWHGIHFLLTGRAFEADGPEAFLMMGGTSLGELHEEFGPARALSAQEIQALYEVVKSITVEELKERYQPEHMQEIYPGFWDPALDGEDFPYLIFYFERLKQFLAQLAEQQKGALVVIH